MPATATASRDERGPAVLRPEVADLLRLSTAGSVDDGKSTLIGRLLHDSRTVLDDQLAHVIEASRDRGDGLDLSLLTDGLRAEREQGITIDVAYRYFTTTRRRFVIADTPGHVQYTRNMVTGASTADLALVLVDARNGLTEQSRRHLAIAGLLRIPHVTVAINKMDLVGWSRERYGELREEFEEFAVELGIRDVTFVPLSALHGDNVVTPSDNLAWYDGAPLLTHLEQVPVAVDRHTRPVRLPVQWVIRAAAARDGATSARPERAYAGQLASGRLTVGQRVVVLPSGCETTVTAIEAGRGPVDSADAPLSVAVKLADHLDVCRGSLIAAAEAPPIEGQDLAAFVCWMGERPLDLRTAYLVKHTTRTVRARPTEVVGVIDLATGRQDAADTLGPNDLGQIRLRAAAALADDPYASNRATGSFVLIDEVTDTTVAAGMLS